MPDRRAHRPRLAVPRTSLLVAVVLFNMIVAGGPLHPQPVHAGNIPAPYSYTDASKLEQRLIQWVFNLRYSAQALNDFQKNGEIGLHAPKRPEIDAPPVPVSLDSENLSALDDLSTRNIGANLAVRVLREVGPPTRNPRLLRYVALVGQTVAAGSADPGEDWRFVVLESKKALAVPCPGGMVFITTGMLDQLGDEAQLAAVLARCVGELTHWLTMKEIRGAYFLRDRRPVDMLAVSDPLFVKMMDELWEATVVDGLNDDHSRRADRLTMDLLYRAGYTPMAAVEILLKKRRTEQGPLQVSFEGPPPQPKTDLDRRITAAVNMLKVYPDWRDMPRLKDRFDAYLTLSRQE